MEVEYGLRRRLLHNIQQGHYPWIKSDDKHDYYRAPGMIIQVNKEFKTMRALADKDQEEKKEK